MVTSSVKCIALFPLHQHPNPLYHSTACYQQRSLNSAVVFLLRLLTETSCICSSPYNRCHLLDPNMHKPWVLVTYDLDL